MALRPTGTAKKIFRLNSPSTAGYPGAVARKYLCLPLKFENQQPYPAHQFVIIFEKSVTALIISEYQ